MKKELSEFKKYVSNYNLKDYRIRYKYDHSIRVMKYANYIAKKLKLDDKDTYMVTLAGLLHDIGRFDQLEKHDTFDDEKSFDHGDYAVDILINNNYLRNYIEDDSYDSDILKSIKYHNKFEIGECNERELLFSKIIRDADKIDIFLNAGIKKFNKHEKNDFTITDIVYNSIMNEKPVDYNDTVNVVDKLLLRVAMIYDLNYKCSFNLIKGRKVIEIIIWHTKSLTTNVETKQKLDDVIIKANQYMRRVTLESGQEV